MSEVKWYPIMYDEYSYVPTVEDFIEDCKNGSFNNDDGTGYWSDTLRRTNIPIDCRELAKGIVLPGYTHVCWFNK
jgi:hypothetical protein